MGLAMQECRVQHLCIHVNVPHISNCTYTNKLYYTLNSYIGGPGKGPGGPGVGGADVPGSGSWFLQLISDNPLRSAVEAPVGKPQLSGGQYAANARCVLARHVLTPSAPVQV